MLPSQTRLPVSVRRRRVKRWLPPAAAILLLATPAGAQMLPETSGNLWFYSPSHRSPFAQAPAAQPAPAPHVHDHQSARDHRGEGKEPC